jgi:hypothetical protein
LTFPIARYPEASRSNTFSDSYGISCWTTCCEVKIDKTDLPGGIMLIAQESFVVEVKSGVEAANVVVLAVVERKQVRKRMFGGGT